MLLTQEKCNELFNAMPLEAQQWVIQVCLELNAACEKHPTWVRDPIHAAAIVAEESGELVRAALQYKYERGTYTEMIKEARQTAAMGIRFLLNSYHPEQ